MKNTSAVSGNDERLWTKILHLKYEYTSADFYDGNSIKPILIKESGSYKLCEDIVFGRTGSGGPLAFDEDLFDPDFTQFDSHKYGLGFFAAISIQTNDVTLYLNGHTIEQSPEHALMQRFFSIIELADSPFIKSVGPAQFVGGDALVPARNVQILGPGTLGRSSHHGIHGNDNRNVKISQVTFREFEVAAVSLNNADNVEISNCDIQQNRQDVPIVGMFSAARFLR